MIKKSNLYKVVFDIMSDKYILASSFKEAIDITHKYLDSPLYKGVLIRSIIYNGEVIYEDNRTED